MENIRTATLRAESYYEIIKELITSLLAVEGFKSYSHECLISFLEYKSRNFNKQEINLIDQLRIIRNDIAYRGIFIEDDYLIRNEKKILEIINKLKGELNRRI